ncbi:hypothetical protein C8F04DRAFT_1273257 [Mycena alexandri]|uniref:Uncharacterized protein n=1 Tax=Mycena alexandri TaxID=1745969 RepID=A0AAD6WP60_9AGAR|nr:hypothetical protein C8F04DRAFT_1273257 [Mycena alexandri]
MLRSDTNDPGPLRFRMSALFFLWLSGFFRYFLLSCGVVRDVSPDVATGDLTQKITVPVQGDLMVQLKKMKGGGREGKWKWEIGEGGGAEDDRGPRRRTPVPSRAYVRGRVLVRVRVLASTDERVESTRRAVDARLPVVRTYGAVFLCGRSDGVHVHMRVARGETELALEPLSGSSSQRRLSCGRAARFFSRGVINTMVNTLAISRPTRVSRDVGTEGKLGAQAHVEDVEGTWRERTDEVNTLTANLTTQVRGIAAVTSAVAKGDLSKQIDAPPLSLSRGPSRPEINTPALALRHSCVRRIFLRPPVAIISLGEGIGERLDDVAQNTHRSNARAVFSTPRLRMPVYTRVVHHIHTSGARFHHRRRACKSIKTSQAQSYHALSSPSRFPPGIGLQHLSP